MRLIIYRFLVVLILSCPALPVQAYDVNDQFSINGILAGVGQCQSVSAQLPSAPYDNDDSLQAFDNACRGAIPLQLEASFHPNDANEFFVKSGFAAGNGLNEASPWVLAPWAADLEENIKNINGGNRDHLLAAWYRHTFSIANNNTLGVTLGILDSTDFLDANKYANDEYTQFMNEAFVNSGSYELPSYDTGAALV